MTRRPASSITLLSRERLSQAFTKLLLREDKTHPEVSPCLGADGTTTAGPGKLYAVRVAAPKKLVPEIIPELKAAGAMGILTSKVNSVVECAAALVQA